MTTVVSSFVTITCDGPDCPNTATFPQTPEGEAEAVATNPWMNALRFVQTPDKRTFIYCGDECEAKAVGSGVHNKRLIETPKNANEVDLAAKAAQHARQATEALKSGQAKVTLG